MKDDALALLAKEHNVAQFVSFGPGDGVPLRHVFIRELDRQPVWGAEEDHDGEAVHDLHSAADELLARTGSVNVRSFLPDKPKGNPFHYGLTKTGDVTALVRSLARDGYHTIVNETIDTGDGGVSGVALGGLIEFTPFDTPRGVEQPGAASLSYRMAQELLHVVYGFGADVRASETERVEFSLHPKRVGYHHTHTVLWEHEKIEPITLRAHLIWPNRFSRLIGDKAYGLLMAHLLGLPVPNTTVIPRLIAPFRFGRPTGTHEIWMRTAPTEPRPGHFPTTFGWSDPFVALARVDPDGEALASVLAQEGVDAKYSGASLPREGGDHVEGVAGHGDQFMLGRMLPQELPRYVADDVRELLTRARKELGHHVRVEFAHDGRVAWVVQLHLAERRYHAQVINPGRPAAGWLDFDPAAGLDALEARIDEARGAGRGIRVTRPIGLTSHVGDLLRRAGVPAKLHVKAPG